MATPDDLNKARELLIVSLEVDDGAANRIADFIALFYSAYARARTQEVVLSAATWAAEQVNALPATQRSRVTLAWVASLTEHRDCPLCMGGSAKRGGSDPTPTTPVDVPQVLGRAGG
jgi:hypothetical protein